MDNLGMLKLFSLLQDTTNQESNKKDWIRSKERLIFATHGIIKPDDWGELSDEVKEERIKKVLVNL